MRVAVLAFLFLSCAASADDVRVESKLFDRLAFYGVAVADGHVYFAPYQKSGHASHGVVVRQKIGPLNEGWETFDLASINPLLVGFSDIARIGDHLYFLGYFTYTNALNGYRFGKELVRYDLRKPFTDKASWEWISVNATAMRGAAVRDGKLYVGQYGTHEVLEITPNKILAKSTIKKFKVKHSYIGGVTAGKCVYFTPMPVDYTTSNGTFIRHCGGSFTDPRAWESFSPQFGFKPAFAGNGAFDGRYVYFAPYQTGSHSYSGKIVRHDTTKPMAVGWETFDQRGVGGGNGYAAAFTVGSSIYFVPYREGVHRPNRKLVSYDSRCTFGRKECWRVVEVDPGGFLGGASDGKHAYLSPIGLGSDWVHGNIVRVTQ